MLLTQGALVRPDQIPLSTVRASRARELKERKSKERERIRSTSPISKFESQAIRPVGYTPIISNSPCKHPTIESTYQYDGSEERIPVEEYLLELISLDPALILATQFLTLDDLYQIFNWPDTYRNLTSISLDDSIILTDQFRERVYQFRNARGVRRLILVFLSIDPEDLLKRQKRENRPLVEIDQNCLLKGLNGLDLADFFWSKRLNTRLGLGYYIISAEYLGRNELRKILIDIFHQWNKLVPSEHRYAKADSFWQNTTLSKSKLREITGRPDFLQGYTDKSTSTLGMIMPQDDANKIDYTVTTQKYLKGPYLESIELVEICKQLTLPEELSRYDLIFPSNTSLLIGSVQLPADEGKLMTTILRRPLIKLKDFFSLPEQTRNVLLGQYGITTEERFQPARWTTLVVPEDRKYLDLSFLQMLFAANIMFRDSLRLFADVHGVEMKNMTRLETLFVLWDRGIVIFDNQNVALELIRKKDNLKYYREVDLFQANLNRGINHVSSRQIEDFTRLNLEIYHHYYTLRAILKVLPHARTTHEIHFFRGIDQFWSDEKVPTGIPGENLESAPIKSRKPLDLKSTWVYYRRDLPSQAQLDQLKEQIYESGRQPEIYEDLYRDFFPSIQVFPNANNLEDTRWIDRVKGFLYRRYPELMPSLTRLWQFENSLRMVSVKILHEKVFWFILLNLSHSSNFGSLKVKITGYRPELDDSDDKEKTQVVPPTPSITLHPLITPTIPPISPSNIIGIVQPIPISGSTISASLVPKIAQFSPEETMGKFWFYPWIRSIMDRIPVQGQLNPHSITYQIGDSSNQVYGWLENFRKRYPTFDPYTLSCLLLNPSRYFLMDYAFCFLEDNQIPFQNLSTDQLFGLFLNGTIEYDKLRVQTVKITRAFNRIFAMILYQPIYQKRLRNLTSRQQNWLMETFFGRKLTNITVLFDVPGNHFLNNFLTLWNAIQLLLIKVIGKKSLNYVLNELEHEVELEPQLTLFYSTPSFLDKIYQVVKTDQTDEGKSKAIKRVNLSLAIWNYLGYDPSGHYEIQIGFFSLETQQVKSSRLYTLEVLTNRIELLSRTNILELNQNLIEGVDSKELGDLLITSPKILLWSQLYKFEGLERTIYQIWGQLWMNQNDWIGLVQSTSFALLYPLLDKYRNYYERTGQAEFDQVELFSQLALLLRESIEVITQWFQQEGIMEFPILRLTYDCSIDPSNNFMEMFSNKIDLSEIIKSNHTEEDLINQLEKLSYFLVNILILIKIRTLIWWLPDQPRYQMSIIFPLQVVQVLSDYPGLTGYFV